jgi:hypothetical protein
MSAVGLPRRCWIFYYILLGRSCSRQPHGLTTQEGCDRELHTAWTQYEAVSQTVDAAVGLVKPTSFLSSPFTHQGPSRSTRPSLCPGPRQSRGVCRRQWNDPGRRARPYRGLLLPCLLLRARRRIAYDHGRRRACRRADQPSELGHLRQRHHHPSTKTLDGWYSVGC